MAKLEVRTVEGITLELDVAGPGTRFLAGLVDGMLLSMLFLLGLLALSVLANFDPTGLSGFLQGFMVLGSLLLVIAYHVIFHALNNGRTPGKTALGIRVVGLDGQTPGLGPLAVRGAMMVVDILPVPLFLGLIVAAVTPKRQRLGDLLAGTLVVREAKAGGRDMEPWSREVWSEQQVHLLALTPASAARFDQEDLDFLRAVITRRGMEAMRRRTFLRRVAKHYLERLGLRRDEDPRAVIRELYLFLREHRGGLREG